jgi:hypothetical protein
MRVYMYDTSNVCEYVHIFLYMNIYIPISETYKRVVYIHTHIDIDIDTSTYGHTVFYIQYTLYAHKHVDHTKKVR